VTSTAQIPGGKQPHVQSFQPGGIDSNQKHTLLARTAAVVVVDVLPEVETEVLL
jgi:Ni,Fe-hydrogenase I large subunit